MRVPPELRIFIYKYCLITGKIYPYLERELEEEEVQTYSSHVNTTATPPSPSTIKENRVALLQVNKTIHVEATPILYQMNTVVLPNARLTARFFNICLNSAKQRRWLKKVELTFCASDMPASLKSSLIASTSPFQRHERLKRHLGHVIWPAKLAAILDHTQLEKLTVHFGESICPMGCCLIDNRALAAFRKGFANGRVPELCLQGISQSMYRHLDYNRPASPNVNPNHFAGMTLPHVSNGSDAERLLQRANRRGIQIARWTKARELGKEQDYGDLQWFRRELEADDEREW